MPTTEHASSPPGASNSQDQQAASRRQGVMAILSEENPQTIADAFAVYGDCPDYELVRAPETGLVMVRGRMGGTGSKFNLGEVTVTRCVVRLDTGEVGSSYILGRHKQHALQAAVFDALWQSPTHHERIEKNVILPLEEARKQKRDEIKAETAATKVDFFTMVRGDD